MTYKGIRMTRTAFFSALSALLATVAAKAQSTIITPCRPRFRWGEQIPLCNGQCPTPDCDFKAPPWKWDQNRVTDPHTAAFYTQLYSNANMPNEPGEMYDVRLLRCPKCNTAFWQDPEKPQ